MVPPLHPAFHDPFSQLRLQPQQQEDICHQAGFSCMGVQAVRFPTSVPSSLVTSLPTPNHAVVYIMHIEIVNNSITILATIIMIGDASNE